MEGLLLLDYGAAGKSRGSRARGGNKKQMSFEAEGMPQGCLGRAQCPQLMGGQGAAERSENTARNEEKTERNEEQSGQKVWKQLVEEDDVPQINGFGRCVPPREVLAFQRGLTRRERWKQQL